MEKKADLRIALLTGIAALGIALASCGGGGGGGGGNGGGGGGGGGTPPTTTPTASPGASGTISVSGNPLANADVIVTCGCSSQAGESTANGSGAFTFTVSATATPNEPAPMYTMVPGRNYLVVGANSSTHAEGWTMFFLGDTPSQDLYMGASGADTTDVATTAASLYVFVNALNDSDTAFDDWNMNTIVAFANELRTAPSTAAETKLMSDITTAESNGTPLYPSLPTWDNDPGSANTTIKNDVDAITSGSDPLVPTPCPLSSGTPVCTGTPTP